MALSFDRVRETADAAVAMATRMVRLYADVHDFLEFSSDQNIAYTPATKTFTAANGSDVCTSNGHGLLNGQKARLTNSGGALPAGLATGTDYYLVGVNTNTFQLSLTLGGAAINFTSDGTGTHTLNPVPDYIVEESGTGNMSGRTYDRIQVSNAIGSLNLLRRILTNQDVTGLMTLAAPGDNLGNLNQLSRAPS